MPQPTVVSLRRIDAICDRFEAEWQAGRIPRVAAFVEQAEDADRSSLRTALEAITADYRARHPEATVRLVCVAGPHEGQDYIFAGHDTFLVGRSKDAHFQLSYDDPYFSRRHFLVEINAPRVRLLDLKSRNGTHANGQRIDVFELKAGDEIRAGHTVFRVSVQMPDPDRQETRNLPADSGRTIDHVAAPEILAGYRLGAELGRGGMGIVYRATRQRDGQKVALKTITPAPGVSRKAIDRFIREAAILRELQHPNIVQFHEFGDAGGTVYIAMELVSGPNAEQVLTEKGPLDIATAVKMTCLLLAALEHAHAKGYVHRDIKPSNLLIGGAKGKRTLKLADFGLARVFEASRISGLTMQGDIGGTPAFMAPEQVTHYREVKPAADLYSAAATLYRLLTRRYVHDLPTAPAMQLVHIMTEPPVPIQERQSEIPEELASVIHKALNREPGDRYPDAPTFRAALRQFANGPIPEVKRGPDDFGNA